MKAIEIKLVMGNEPNEEAGADADGQADGIDESVDPIFGETADGGFEIAAEHAK